MTFGSALFSILPALLGLALSANSYAAKFEVMPIGSLHPTQFNVGFHEVEIRKAEILTEIAKGPESFKKYLIKKTVPLVRGPNGALYLIDGHHFSRALYELGIESVLTQVIYKFDSDVSEKKFWKKMQKEKWVHARDLGVERPETDIPTTVAKLTNDPYRSLAWAVKAAHGYQKTGVPFEEFKWADYFRSLGLSTDFSNPVSTQITLARALYFARSKQAKDLGGHIGGLPHETLSCILKSMKNGILNGIR